jgi:hypothetical protein
VANRYSRLIERVFVSKYTKGATEVAFSRTDLELAAEQEKIKLPKNLGDVIYSFRFRSPLPTLIQTMAPKGRQWVIRGTGRGLYTFAAVGTTRVIPTERLIVTKVPDNTPEIISANTLGDEQALLALVRYNRLIDIFLGVTAYSLQNHLRTTAPNIGQVEVDEIYVAVDRHGTQFVVPVQAKGGTDQIGITQAEQDLAVCRAKFPDLIPRALAAQFMANGVIALFELAVQDDEIVIVRESHYKLVPASEISAEDRRAYAQNSGLSLR